MKSFFRQMYYDPTIVAITRILARTPRLTRSLVRIGRLQGAFRGRDDIRWHKRGVCSERAVVEGASVNKYQYACSSVNNNCIKPDVYPVY